jgi:hypothetical protein
MSSYLPPSDNLPSFNPSVFQSSFTDEEVESKIKTLETKNKFVSVDTTDGDKYNISLGNNGTFKVLAKENSSQGTFITDMKTGTDCTMYIGDGCDELIATRDSDTFLERHTLLTLRQNGVTSGQGRPLLVMKFNTGSDTNDYDWNKRYTFSQNGDDLKVMYNDGTNSVSAGSYGSGTISNMKFKSTGGITIGDSKFPTVATTQQHITSGLNDDGTSTGTQSFGITYTSAPVVTCQVIYQTAGGYVVVNIHTVTTTGFSYRKFRTGTGGATAVSTDGEFYWNAIGDASL